MIQAKVLAIECLYERASNGEAHAQAIPSCEALLLKMNPPKKKPRLIRLRDELKVMKDTCLGIRHTDLISLEKKYENCLLDQYLKFGGEVLYGTYKSENNVIHSTKCKPYTKDRGYVQ